MLEKGHYTATLAASGEPTLIHHDGKGIWTHQGAIVELNRDVTDVLPIAVNVTEIRKLMRTEYLSKLATTPPWVLPNVVSAAVNKVISHNSDGYPLSFKSAFTMLLFDVQRGINSYEEHLGDNPHYEDAIKAVKALNNTPLYLPSAYLPDNLAKDLRKQLSEPYTLYNYLQLLPEPVAVTRTEEEKAQLISDYLTKELHNALKGYDEEAYALAQHVDILLSDNNSEAFVQHRSRILDEVLYSLLERLSDDTVDIDIVALGADLPIDLLKDIRGFYLQDPALVAEEASKPSFL